MDLVQKIATDEKAIAEFKLKTALEKSVYLSAETSANVYLKCENFQRTGSFKFRGAINKCRILKEAGEQQVITASTGNHGLGVALASQIWGLKAQIYVPYDAAPLKLEAIKAYGAEYVKVDGDCLLAEETARQVAKDQKLPYISPYNDEDVMAGQGSIGVELWEQLPDLDAVFISVGGGGLVSGIATYLKAKNPNIEVVGCWPENAPVMAECLKAGEVIEVSEIETLSDATAGGIEKESITFPICQKLIDQQVLVSEDEIKASIKRIAEHERMMVEGAAAVAYASYLKVAQNYKGKNIAILLCGRNIGFEKFLEVIV